MYNVSNGTLNPTILYYFNSNYRPTTQHLTTVHKFDQPANDVAKQSRSAPSPHYVS